jgi:hypothetical protein
VEAPTESTHRLAVARSFDGCDRVGHAADAGSELGLPRNSAPASMCRWRGTR